MKKILFVFSMLLTINLFAQQQIYFTTFSANVSHPGWEKQTTSGEYDWRFGGVVLPGSSNFSAPAAIFNDDITMELGDISSIISPTWNLNGYNILQLSYEYGLNQAGQGGKMTVEVFDGINWQQVAVYNQTQTPTTIAPIDVTEYKNAAFKVRFTYDDEYTYGMGCGVTNFRLEGTYTTTPNSECLNAGLLYCGASGNGTTIGSTVKDELAPYGGLSPNGSYGVWYKYSNIGNQSDVTFSLCDTTQVFDSKVIVYKGSCADLFPIASNDDACGINSKVTFRNDGVSTYYILVFGEEVSTSDFSYTLTCNDVVPANDDIENAIDVNPFTQPYTDIAVPLINATMEADSADFIKTGCDMGAGWYPNVFYKFMAEKNGTATASFSTPNGGGFNIIGFYTAPDKNAAIADLSFASGQQCNQYSSSKSISITEGTVYYVVMMSPYTNSDILINLEYDSMAVSEVHNLKLNIYPNPVKDLLNIESNDELSKVEIFDLSGKQIFLQKTGSKNLQLNISSLNAGTYILKASSAMKVLTSKIIKK